MVYGCLGSHGMPAGIPGAGHEDTQRSLLVAPAAVVDYTPGRASVQRTRRLHRRAGVLKHGVAARHAAALRCTRPPAPKTGGNGQVRMRPCLIQAIHV